MGRAALTLVEIVGLMAVALALAFGSNALRADGLKLSKSYFEKPPSASRPATQTAPAGDGESDAASGGSTQSGKSDAPEHDFAVVTFEDVVQIINDPLYGTGTSILIDARDDEHFAEGRIPGAWQLYSYHAEQYLDTVIPLAFDAERVIIYCTGGDCEDSLLTARELINSGIERDRIILYEGGMEEWQANGGALEEGPLE